MTLTTAVLLVLLLFVVQLFLQETSRYRFNLWEIMGNRDASPQESVVAARLNRAKQTNSHSSTFHYGKTVRYTNLE